MAPRGALTRLLGALALITCATATATAQTTPSSNGNTTTPAPVLVGGWKTVPVTDRESALLERALSNVSSYRAGVTARVCVREIKSLTQQLVAGTNYRFVVEACGVAANSDKSVGLCAGKSGAASECSEYSIRLFEQTWTKTLEVVAIESSSGAPSSSTDAPASSSPSGTTTATSAPTTTANSSRSSTSNSTSTSNDSKSNATDAKTPVVTTATTTAPKDSAASSATRSAALGALFALVLASVVVA